MIYITEHTDRLDGNFLEKSQNLLSSQRMEHIGKYALMSDRINGTLAYLLLKYGLEMEYGIKEKPVFEYRERGKPYLQGYENIYFNMSHCKNAVVCILSDKNTAVDIMDIRKVGRGVIRRTCTENEKNLLLSSTQPDRDFIRLWTRKECYSKFDGRGLLMDFSQIGEDMPEMENIHTVDCGEYILSYYAEKPAAVIAVKAEELLERRNLF